jgi:hypothetical protein
VDYASRAIVQLSRQPQALSQTFHLFNQQTFTWKTLLQWLHAAGYHFEMMSYEQWRQALLEELVRNPDHALSPFLPLFVRPLSGNQGLPLFQIRHYNQHNVQAGLKGTQVACPVVNQQLMQNYITFFQQNGFFPVPDFHVLKE